MRLVLYEPEIARNAGAATRAAACFGAGLDIIEPCGFPLNAKAFSRVAMDYGLLAAPRVHSSWSAFDEARRFAGARLVLLTTKADNSVTDFTFQQTDWIMTGRESAGVPDAVHASVDASVRIALAKGARSLNMATAAAIALAEARRQIGYPDE
ncbi:MAG: TrmH family RNA methyltransferase [Pseudomonadota bacterium]